MAARHLILGLYKALRSLTAALVVGRVASRRAVAVQRRMRPCMPAPQALYGMAIPRPRPPGAILHSAFLILHSCPNFTPVAWTMAVQPPQNNFARIAFQFSHFLGR